MRPHLRLPARAPGIHPAPARETHLAALVLEPAIVPSQAARQPLRRRQERDFVGRAEESREPAGRQRRRAEGEGRGRVSCLAGQAGAHGLAAGVRRGGVPEGGGAKGACVPSVRVSSTGGKQVAIFWNLLCIYFTFEFVFIRRSDYVMRHTSSDYTEMWFVSSQI